jgi:hypothetical protein
MQISERTDNSIVPTLGTTDGGVKWYTPRPYFEFIPVPEFRIRHCVTSSATRLWEAEIGAEHNAFHVLPNVKNSVLPMSHPC